MTVSRSMNLGFGFVGTETRQGVFRCRITSCKTVGTEKLRRVWVNGEW